MRGALKLFRKDLQEILGSPRSLVMLLVLPSLILVLAGELDARKPAFRLLIAGAPDRSRSQPARVFDELLDIVQELEPLEIRSAARPVDDPLTVLQRQDLDLVLNVEDDRPETWRIYVAEADTQRLLLLRRLSADLDRLIRFLYREETECAFRTVRGCEDFRLEERKSDSRAPARTEGGDPAESTSGPGDLRRWSAEVESGAAAGIEADDGTPADAEQELDEWMQRVGMLGMLPPPRLIDYYPQAGQWRFNLLTRTVALLLCFIPFVLTAPALIREREGGTLDLLMVAPGGGVRAIVAGKCLFALAVTAFNLAIFLVLLDSVYGIHIKPGLAWMSVLVLIAALCSALLGLSSSVLVTSQNQAMAAAAGYFLGMLLLGDFLYPVERSSVIIGVLSKLFPLTFLRPALRDWLVGLPTDLAGRSGLWLLAQGSLVAVLAIPLVARRLRRS